MFRARRRAAFHGRNLARARIAPAALLRAVEEQLHPRGERTRLWADVRALALAGRDHGGGGPAECAGPLALHPDGFAARFQARSQSAPAAPMVGAWHVRQPL